MTGILMASVGNSYGSAPVNTVAPAVTGTATFGSTLTTTNGTWLGAPAPTFTYQWFRSPSTSISGATSSTYVLVQADVGFGIFCRVTATNSVAPSGVTADSNTTATVAAVVPGAPTIGTATSTGQTTATVAYTAPASNGGATITLYTATSSPGSITGTLSQAGSGTITVSGLTASTSYTFTVRATNSAGQGAASGSSNSITTAANPPVNTVAPTVSGSTLFGSSLSSTTGTWTGVGITYTYQWKRNGSNIGGATSSSYTSVYADVGTSVTCTVTATNTGGSVSAGSSNSITVSLPAIGQSFGGGYYVGRYSLNGNNTATHLLVVAPKSSGEGYYKYNDVYQSIASAESQSDGLANSIAAYAASRPAIYWARNLSIGGFSDWYLPSYQELNCCFYYLKPQGFSNNTTNSSPWPPYQKSGYNPYIVPQRLYEWGSGNSDPSKTSITAFQSGNSEAFEENVYTSSSMAPSQANAGTVLFSTGAVSTINVQNPGWVRAMRRIAI